MAAHEPLHEELDFETGLPDHIQGTTTEAVFGYDEESQMPDRLNLDVTFRDEEGEEHNFRYPVNGFITTDDGETCEREDGTDKKFNVNSAPALLINSIVKNGGQDVILGRLNNDLTPRHAALYVNLDMQMYREEMTFKNDDGEEIAYNRMLCEEFYGEVGAGGGGVSKSKGATKKAGAAKKGAVKKSGAKKKTAAKKDEEESDEGGISPDVLAQLDSIADECETHDEFMSRVIDEVDGAGESDEILSAISEDENVEGSVWARAFERAG